jgi:predicted amidohydrolase
METKRRRAAAGTAPRGELRVAAVQMRFAGTIAGNLATIDRLVRAAAAGGADAVLLPECATTGYSYDFSSLTPADVRDALAAVAASAARHRVNLLVGSPVFRGRQLCNGLVVFDRAGVATSCYAKCQLTDLDRRCFAPGDAVALFTIDGVPATAIICHERRYPELPRLAVMAGARVIFHPNAGLDPLAVSRRKRGGHDGIVARAFENAAYYVFANSVGPQGGGLWSAGDSKIVAPDERVLALADNAHEAIIAARLDLAAATGSYAARGLVAPPFLAPHWKRMIAAVRKRAATAWREFDLPAPPAAPHRRGPRSQRG